MTELTATLSHWRQALARWLPAPDPTRPYRWICRLADGVMLTVDVTPAPDGSVDVALEAPLVYDWPGLVIMPRAHALATAGALTTGDAALDAQAVILGAEGHRGRFDHTLRAHLVALVGLGGLVAAGVVHVPSGATRRVPAHATGEVILRIFALARDLYPLEESANDEAIIRLGVEDPDPAVRAVFRGLSDDPQRFMAATRWAIEHTGPDDVEQLARHLGDLELPAELRTLAAARLFALAPVARLVELPPEVWAGVALEEVEAAIVATHSGAPEGDARRVAALVRGLAGERWSQLPAGLARVALTTLAEPLGPNDEALLLALLDHPDASIEQTAGRHLLALAPLASLWHRIVRTRRAPGLWRGPLFEPLWQRLRLELKARPDGDTRARVRDVLAAVVPSPMRLPAAHALELTTWFTGWDDPRALEVTGSLLLHEDRAVRRAALGALAHAPRADAARAVIPIEATEQAVRLAPDVVREQRVGADLLVSLWLHVNDRDADLYREFVAALGAVGTGAHAPRLLPLLASPYDDVVSAALDALGAIGTPAELDALEPLTKGLFRASATKERARAAMAAIVARCGDASGGLSLSDPTAPGRLTLG